MDKITELLKEADKLLDESDVLETDAEKHLENGNELEWEQAGYQTRKNE